MSDVSGQLAATSNQWFRKASLIVSSGTVGLDLSTLQFSFKVENADIEVPNIAVIRVYNLSTKTEAKIRGEYSQVTLQAGYQNGNYGIIFQGTVIQYVRGRLNATDSYLDIVAADGDFAYNNSVINMTIDGAASVAKIQEALNGAWTKSGAAQIGQQQAASSGGVLPRGKVMYGMTRAFQRDLSKTTLTSWSIQNGAVTVIKQTGYLPGEAVVLTSRTGLIGMPQQTDNGITVQCLLNAKMRIGGLVKIDNASINEAQINVDYTAINLLADITADGIYRILVCEHEGNTRANPWYTNLVCLAVDQSAKTPNQINPYLAGWNGVKPSVQ